MSARVRGFPDMAECAGRHATAVNRMTKREDRCTLGVYSARMRSVNLAR
jgi:hypothetical protein